MLNGERYSVYRFTNLFQLLASTYIQTLHVNNAPILQSFDFFFVFDSILCSCEIFVH